MVQYTVFLPVESRFFRICMKSNIFPCVFVSQNCNTDRFLGELINCGCKRTNRYNFHFVTERSVLCADQLPREQLYQMDHNSIAKRNHQQHTFVVNIKFYNLSISIESTYQRFCQPGFLSPHETDEILLGSISHEPGARRLPAKVGAGGSLFPFTFFS